MPEAIFLNSGAGSPCHQNRTKGGVASLACASALTELVRGMTVGEALELNRGELVRSLGGLPAASIHASHPTMDALRAALDKLRV